MPIYRHDPEPSDDGISCGNFAIRFLAGFLALVFAGVALWITSVGESEFIQFAVTLAFLAFACGYIAVNPSKQKMRFENTSMPNKSISQDDESTSFSYEVSRLVRVLVVGASGYFPHVWIRLNLLDTP